MKDKVFYTLTFCMCILVKFISEDRFAFGIIGSASYILNIMAIAFLLCILFLVGYGLFIIVAKTREFKRKVIIPALIIVFYAFVYIAFIMISDEIYGLRINESVLWLVPFIALTIVHYFVYSKDDDHKDSNIVIFMGCYVLGGLITLFAGFVDFMI